MNVQTPLGLTISVYQGHQNEGFADLVPLATVEVERWYMAPGVRRVNVTEDGLSATLFLPPGRTRVCGWGVASLLRLIHTEKQVCSASALGKRAVPSQGRAETQVVSCVLKENNSETKLFCSFEYCLKYRCVNTERKKQTNCRYYTKYRY